MSAPRIAPFSEVSHDRALGLSTLAAPECAGAEGLFVVLKSGYAMGCWWKRGDVVACSRVRARGTNVVLVPTGYGWPRLGYQTSYGELSGDAGEPCRTDRWRVAGEIEYVLRRAGDGEWHRVNHRESLESPVEQSPSLWESPIETIKPYAVGGWSTDNEEKAVSQTAVARQLSLFTRTAIAA